MEAESDTRPTITVDLARRPRRNRAWAICYLLRSVGRTGEMNGDGQGNRRCERQDDE